MVKKIARYLICTTFLALGAGETISAEKNMSIAEAINKSGRQRMLTQRIVKSYCQMGQDVRYLAANKQLKNALILFEQQLELLNAFTDDPETKRALKLVEKLWDPVKLIAVDEIERDKASKLRNNAEKLLVASHQVVLLLEDQSGTNQGHLVNIAGRQRMLSQRLGNLYMLLSWGFDNPEFRTDYNKAKREFGEALLELISAQENTPQISSELRKVSQNWDMFKLSDRMGKDEYVPGLVARMLDKILIQMNDITGYYAALP